MEEEVKDPQALLKAYEKAKADLVALREENKGLKAQVEGDSSASDEWKNKALAAETRLALQATGIKDVDRLMPYVGTEGISFSEDGSLVGLTDRIETLKKDLPELFDVKRRVGGKADIFADTPGEKPISASEKQAALIMGG